MVMNFPDDHFITKYLQWAMKQCDAPWEYHEAMALCLLGASVPDVRAQLTIYPDGLPCNLYLCFLGETTRYRKSTAKDLGQALYHDVDQKGVMPDRMTPEGFIDQLGDRSPGSSLWLHDEFGKFLIELHRRDHLQPLQGLILAAFSGRDYLYTRVRKGKLKDVDDNVLVQKPHLNIVGCATPDIFKGLHAQDLLSGLLPRFAVIMPTSLPDRIPFYALADNGQRRERNALVQFLHHVRPVSNAPPRTIMFSDESLNIIDEKVKTLELQTSQLMTARLPSIALKIAMISAIGRPPQALGPQSFEVSTDDARSAVAVINRWETYAVEFEKRVGEGVTEELIRKVMALFRQCNARRPSADQRTPLRITRHTVARVLHIDSKPMVEVQQVLEDRGVIEIEEGKNRRKDSAIWVWNGHDGESTVSL